MEKATNGFNTAQTAPGEALAISQNPFDQREIDAARGMVQQAQGQVELVDQQLAETYILAPFDGFVLRRLLSSGALASPQTPLVTVSGDEVLISMKNDQSQSENRTVMKPGDIR